MPQTDERSTGELLKELSQQTTTLVRKEIELAKAEVSEKGKQAGVGAGMFGGAGLFGLLAMIALTSTLIRALDTGMAGWLAALIVTVLWAAVAGVLALVAKNKVQEAMPPAEETLETVKEDVEWAKTQKQSVAR